MHTEERSPGWFSRLPIRIRLTAISALITVVLFGLLGGVLYLEFQHSLRRSGAESRRLRAAELSLLAHDADRARSASEVTAIDRARVETLDLQQDGFVTFTWEMVAGLPLLVVISAAVTYIVGGRFLAPVESLRRRAAAISTERPDARLPLPESRDEIHALAVTLNAMLDRLEAGVSRELRFVSDASHELRTPLAVLRGELELALRIDGSREEWHAAAESAIEETDRLTTLTEGLLTLARGQDGALPLVPAPLDAAELLSRVARRVELPAGRTVRVVPGPPVRLVADGWWIEQAVLGLLINAVHHGDGGTVLSARRVDGSVQLHVADRGPGLPTEFLPHAFERFARADGARARGGTGLGLSIVAMIACAHGGRAEIRNRAGGGADAWITLPGADDPRPADVGSRSRQASGESR